MATINQRLLARLEHKLGVSKQQVYSRIQRKAAETFLDRDLAAIALAADHGINISRFANAQQLSAIRNANGGRSSSAPVVRVPAQVRAPTTGRGARSGKRSEQVERRGNTVFVVYGRNDRLRQAVFAFLRSVGLHPLEWSQAIKLTRKGSPHVSDILDAAFRKAVAVVVLLTPDDEAKLNRRFLTPNDPEYERQLTGQARPNVLFEAGMAFGRNPDATVLVQAGPLRPFSDVAGRHVVHLSNSLARRQELITKLANAGCNVDASGTDWHTEGDFSV